MDEIERQLSEAEKRRDKLARDLGTAEQNMLRLRRGEKFQPMERPNHKGFLLEEAAEHEELVKAQIDRLRVDWQGANREVMYLQGVLRMPPAVREQVLRQRRAQEENRLRGASPQARRAEEQKHVEDAHEKVRREAIEKQKAAQQEAAKKRAEPKP